jgi:Ca2+-transporting ATPase
MTKINGFTGEFKGLTSIEVKQHLEQYGKNELTSEKKVTIMSKVLGIFKEPMFLLLFCTALIYFILGEARDGVIMLCFVAFMASINFIQEWRTDKTLQALKELSAPHVRVIRNDIIESIESKELTVGDIMLLEEGEKISADAKILEMYDLGVDESTLTGESEIVWKSLSVDTDKDLHWRKDYCYAGTTVTQGSAITEVTAIGVKTEYGKIGADIMSVPEHPTPLEKQTRQLIKICALIGFGLFILVALVTFIHSNSIVQSILSGITLAMAMIPEEFPVILTVFLAMGAWRLAKKNSLIRRMPSVETLGSVSVLCVDKTGTLTKNQMTVQELYCSDNNTEKEIIYWASLGCETEPYDPMEKAILQYAGENGINKEELFNRILLHEYPFSSETKMMGHIWLDEGGNTSALSAKGSPESILPLCHLSADEQEIAANAQNSLALKGYRVIAVARRINMPTEKFPSKLQDNELKLVGLLGLQDPPRESVPESIKLCNKAGIRVVMITGDNGVTAKSIAASIGIKCSEKVITGQELEAMSDIELAEQVKTTNIFARVIPRHKMRIVKALKDNGEIVAMTGDGVNDAPALKYSDIGIAMGKRGTGVAKEAADMILLDDNFSTIVDTIKDGRRIYDNIRKAVGYVFVIHIPIALLALLTPLLHLPLVLLPIHVVLLELIIDPTCSIVFERQPAEKDIMNRKPRLADTPLITSNLMVKSLLQGLVIFAAAFGTYSYLFNTGAGEAVARTFTLIVLGFANLFLVYENQSDNGFILTSLFTFKDKVVTIVNLGIVFALLLVTYLPAANSIAQTSSLNPAQFLCAVGIAALSTFWWEIIKIINKMKLKRLNQSEKGSIYTKNSINQ